MSKLQKALAYNAIFSLLTGFLLVVLYSTLSDLFEIKNELVFIIIGVGLLLFSAGVTFVIVKQSPTLTLLIILLDVIWIIGSIAIFLFAPFGISNMGNYIILVVAFIVLCMAIKQSMALAKVDSINAEGRKKLSFKRTIYSNKAKVWKVVSDVANYDQVASNIDNVEIVSGEGVGMVRACSHGKDKWTETCSIWKEEETYSFVVNTSAADYPYPLSFLQGTWNVIEVNSNETEIEMIFEFEYSKKIMNVVFHPIMKLKFRKICDELLDNWQNVIQK